MFQIIEKKNGLATVKCDIKTLSKIEDFFDSNPDNYSSLDADIDPEEVINFIKNIKKNGRKTTKIHPQVTI